MKSSRVESIFCLTCRDLEEGHGELAAPTRLERVIGEAGAFDSLCLGCLVGRQHQRLSPLSKDFHRQCLPDVYSS